MTRDDADHPDEGREFSQWRPHPWHGLPAGANPPRLVTAYVEMTPFDLVKYEVDRISGRLRVDRPQKTSSVLPSLYGFIPRTCCARRTAARSPDAEQGDADPLDVCVVSELPVNRAEVILDARVVGGVRTLDGGRADDKIVAVLDGDIIWGEAETLEDVPSTLVDRLRHYFATYKMSADGANPVEVRETFDRDEAFAVIRAAIEDYRQMVDRFRRPR